MGRRAAATRRAAAGLLTSAAWGAAIGASVGLAYVRRPDGSVVTPDYLKSGRYQVNVGGRVCGRQCRCARRSTQAGRRCADDHQPGNNLKEPTRSDLA